MLRWSPDTNPRPADLKDAKRIWNEYVRRQLGPTYFGEIRDGKDPSLRAIPVRIDIVDGGPGGNYDVMLVVIEKFKIGDTGTLVASTRYNVLDKMLDRHQEIEETNDISGRERNRRRNDLWDHTLRYDIEDSIAAGEFTKFLNKIKRDRVERFLHRE